MAQHTSSFSASAHQEIQSASRPDLQLLNIIRQQCPELSIEDVFPVPAWFVDQRSWIQDPWKSNSVAYNLPLSLRIRGMLNRDALMSALQQVQQRHQVLRSVFRLVNDQLAQVVLPDG